MKLKLTFEKAAHSMVTAVLLIDASGDVEKWWTIAHSPKKDTKVKWKLKKADQYRFEVIGLSGGGGIGIQTGMSLPSSAKTSKTVEKPDKGAEAATFEIQALSGGTLDATFEPKSGFPGPMSLTFRTPAGVEIDVTAFQQAFGNGGLELSSLPLDLPGTYEIEIGGFEKKKHKVKAKLQPTQPEHTASVVKIL